MTLRVLARVFPAGHVQTSRSLSKVKSSRLKVPSSRFDLSMTGMCGAIRCPLARKDRVRRLSLDPTTRATVRPIATKAGARPDRMLAYFEGATIDRATEALGERGRQAALC